MRRMGMGRQCVSVRKRGRSEEQIQILRTNNKYKHKHKLGIGNFNGIFLDSISVARFFSIYLKIISQKWERKHEMRHTEICHFQFNIHFFCRPFSNRPSEWIIWIFTRGFVHCSMQTPAYKLTSSQRIYISIHRWLVRPFMVWWILF